MNRLRSSVARALTVLALFAAITATGGGAHAQNALGDGRALDNSLLAGTRTNAARPNLQQEINFRNAIATGNAPGGLSFRGDLGYTDPSAFRGELGSNDTFAFRRDSLTSGLAGMGIRGTEALQYQMALTTGGRPPSNLIGGYTVSTAGSGVTSAAVASGQPNPFTVRSSGVTVGGADPQGLPALRQRPADDPQADPRGSLLWTLRSPSAYVASQDLQPTLLGVREPNAEDRVRRGLTASTLRGVQLVPLAEMTAEDEPEPEDARQPDPNNPVSWNQLDPGRINEAVDPGAQTPNRLETARPAQQPRTAHEIIRQRLAQAEAEENDADAPRPGGPADTLSRFDRLRGQLLAPVAPMTATRDSDEGDEPDPEAARPETPFQDDDVDALRRETDPVERFIRVDEDTDFFAQHMRRGESLLRSERYFDAEERFTTALSIKPGDVTAQIGRVHAQIGAGLYLSASINLTQLLVEHPEMIGARFGDNLLPGPERAEQIIDHMLDVLSPQEDSPRPPGPRLRQAAGLLLAYLGRQTGDRGAIETGLEAYAGGAEEALANDPENQDLARDVRLGELLTRVWSGGVDGTGTDGGRADDPEPGSDTGGG